QLLDTNLRPVSILEHGQPATVRIRARFSKPSAEPIAGLLIRNRLGIDVYGTNTRAEQLSLGSFQPGEILELDFHFECWLVRQEYTITVAMQHSSGESQDWLDDALSFAVASVKDLAGVADLRARVQWRKH
ncbi:MAG: Wzt carbohydrate-binding domain-containing protein, partial [Bryobacterales bacterium]|nr:Wzt carbohydrate-binding domain-containing protein [Bryobacterales bacterium]